MKKILTFEEFLNESSNQPEKMETIWSKYGDDLPSIFKYTTYRLPNTSELEEIGDYDFICT